MVLVFYKLNSAIEGSALHVCAVKTVRPFAHQCWPIRMERWPTGGRIRTEHWPTQALLETFQQHMTAEITGDLDATMATMTDNPHVKHVPVMIGGVGHAGVRYFYSNHLVGKFFPPDAELIPVSRTIGSDQLVEEVVLTFTHTRP